MTAGGSDSALLQDDDPVSAEHGCQTVGDDNRGTARRQRGQRALHSKLRLGIERARRLIEQQDRRVSQDGSGDRKALTLPAREAYALLAEKRVETARQVVEELGRVRRLSGGADLRLCCAGSTEADVFPSIGAEDYRVLREQSDALAHLRRIGGAQIDPIDPHGTVLWIVKP